MQQQLESIFEFEEPPTTVPPPVELTELLNSKHHLIRTKTVPSYVKVLASPIPGRKNKPVNSLSMSCEFNSHALTPHSPRAFASGPPFSGTPPYSQEPLANEGETKDDLGKAIFIIKD